MSYTDFVILSAPVAISFDCPHCGRDNIKIPWKDVDAPDCWGDRWPDVECPFCRKPVQLGEWEYD
ncbi:MAG: hypothetical protein IJ418_02500 [Clostridia bacterium]|nr:hypothetical protein [Clostridia bacterium]